MFDGRVVRVGGVLFGGFAGGGAGVVVVGVVHFLGGVGGGHFGGEVMVEEVRLMFFRPDAAREWACLPFRVDSTPDAVRNYFPGGLDPDD